MNKLFEIKVKYDAPGKKTITYIVSAENQSKAKYCVAESDEEYCATEEAQITSIKELENTELLLDTSYYTDEKLEYCRTVYGRYCDALDQKMCNDNKKYSSAQKLFFDSENETEVIDVEKLKKAMELMQMTQTEFAKEIGVSPAVLSHILHGRNNMNVEIREKVSNIIQRFEKV